MNESIKALKTIRDAALILGWDTSGLSDIELEERILEGNKAISNFGLTTEQAIENLNLSMKTLKEMK